MKTSKAHIEDMQAKLASIANNEQLLINALGEALCIADKKLLDDVRSLTIEHETRRGVILSELQNLASRIGAFPTNEDGPETIVQEANLDLPYYEPGGNPPAQVPGVADLDVDEPKPGGDWRQAAKNIRDELGLALNAKKAVG
ncbi:MAG: hypothetical protein K0U74_07890 [Alphaproteobacteria bacterium]|nr:hypothetical protein [Alphaproteobacteria bacterium]